MSIRLRMLIEWAVWAIISVRVDQSQAMPSKTVDNMTDYFRLIRRTGHLLVALELGHPLA